MKSMISHDDARLSPITSKKEEIIISVSIAVIRIEAKTKILRLVSFRESLKALEEDRICLILEKDFGLVNTISLYCRYNWIYNNSTTTTTSHHIMIVWNKRGDE
jgi:hypothetical protein